MPTARNAEKDRNMKNIFDLDLSIGAYTRNRYVDFAFRGCGNRAARRASKTQWAESFRAEITEKLQLSAQAALFERGQLLAAR